MKTQCIFLSLMLYLSCFSIGKADTFVLNLNMTGTVNGQPLAASFTGAVGDSSTGVATVDWTIDATPAGFSVFGSTYFTASSFMHVFSREDHGASNLFTLTNGNYSVDSTVTYPDGNQVFANLIVSTSENVVNGTAVFSGTADLPLLNGVQSNGPAIWTPGPRRNQFTETFTKFLLRVDGGEPIIAENMRVYTLEPGSFLPEVQFRSLNLEVLESIPNIHSPTSSTLRYTDIVDVFLLGDVNCDNVVNLLDVRPFVNLILNGKYSFKADINGDGIVDLLDVGPFVDLLTG